MPVNMPDGPPESRQALNEGLDRMPARRRNVFATMAAGGAAPSITHPHQVFVLTPDLLLSGRGLEAARPTGWRYLLNQPTLALAAGTATASAEVAEREGRHEFQQLQYGWLGNATLQTIDAVQNDAAVNAGSYDLRMLRVPALRLDAIWLKNNNPGLDLVVPIASQDPRLRPQQVYQAADFINVAHDIARDMPTTSNAPRPQ
jgi:hypothetical protein